MPGGVDGDGGVRGVVGIDTDGDHGQLEALGEDEAKNHALAAANGDKDAALHAWNGAGLPERGPVSAEQLGRGARDCARHVTPGWHPVRRPRRVATWTSRRAPDGRAPPRPAGAVPPSA